MFDWEEWKGIMAEGINIISALVLILITLTVTLTVCFKLGKWILNL